MERVYIFGPKYIGQRAYDRWQEYSNKGYELVAFISTRKTGTCKGLPIVNVEDVDKDAVVIIALGANYIVEVYRELERHGIHKIFKFLNLECAKQGEDFIPHECIALKGFGAHTLPYVEIHAVDYCNLNCKGCTHYSPLFEKTLPDLEGRLEDVRLLKRKFSDIACLHVLGGEPLLHPGLDVFLKKLRAILPKTDLYLVTNGLLVPKMSEATAKAILDNDIIMIVSEYAPTHKIIRQIEARLKAYAIRYSLRAWDEKQTFNRPLSLSDNSQYKRCCISNGCVNIWDGKIARCPSLMYIDKFNEVFGTHLPNEGIFDLRNCPDGDGLLQLLQKEVPLCKHCVENSMEWEHCGRTVTVEDFAAID